MSDDIHEQLTTWLEDAHSIEEQALRQMEKAPAIAVDPGFVAALERHRRETAKHERLIRELLEERGAEPSQVQDAVMRAGGTGFVLFAKAQTDTPGKLAAHVLAYEALEWAAYDLLARAANRADEGEVARIARDIRDEERIMMERIEGVFDGTVEASLREGGADLSQRLLTYLADAHAIEAQSIQLLESVDDMVEGTPLERVFEAHLDESRTQQGLLERRLEQLGGRRSVLKDAALRMGAFNWGMFFQAEPDTPAKLAAFTYAFEHLEIGGYEQLRRVARRAGDETTARLAERILAEERLAAEKIASTFADALSAVLATR